VVLDSGGTNFLSLECFNCIFIDDAQRVKRDKSRSKSLHSDGDYQGHLQRWPVNAVASQTATPC
jgi:hypothetical protein